jgi:hypothetical protein
MYLIFFGQPALENPKMAGSTLGKSGANVPRVLIPTVTDFLEMIWGDLSFGEIERNLPKYMAAGQRFMQLGLLIPNLFANHTKSEVENAVY